MKILYVYHALAIKGGVERVWIEKMNQLTRLYNYDIYLITYNQGDHKIPFPLDERVKHVDLNVRTHQKYLYYGIKRIWEGFLLHKLLYRRLKESITRIEPDVIVTTTAGEISLLLKIKGDIPIVVESHSGYDHITEPLHKTCVNQCQLFMLKCKLKKVDTIVTLTESDAKKWRMAYKHIYAIPNLVNLNNSGNYSILKEKRVLFIGRNVNQKGIPELLKIWQIVNKNHPDWKLDIYGEGFDQQWIRKYVYSLNININLNAPVEDIHNLYINSSIFILTSNYEPFGLVIPEAMSCGLPVVSFEGDGPNLIIEDSQDGFIIKDRNINDFADKVCLLIENEQLRKQMGSKAIQSSKRFDASKIMPMWDSFFKLLLVK